MWCRTVPGLTMVFKAEPTGLRWEGLAVCAWIVLIDILCVLWLWQRPVDWLKFSLLTLLLLSLPIFFYVAYRTWSLFSLEYWVDRNAITVSWAGQHQIIPLHAIQRVIEDGEQETGKAPWWYWPSLDMRTGHTGDQKNLTMLATRPLSQCLLLDIGTNVFAISPRDMPRFLEIVQERYQLGPAIHARVERRNVAPVTRLWAKIIGRDKVGMTLLLGGVLGILVLFGTLMIRFPGLPGDLVVRYQADGQPELIRDKSSLFLLPAIGFMAWLVNGFLGAWMAVHDQPIGSYLLWGGAIVVQIFSLLALLALMP